MNQSVRELYDEYRDEMKRMIDIPEHSPFKFANVEFVEHFELKIQRLDTLISLYHDLLAARKS